MEKEAGRGGFRLPKDAADFDNMPPFMRPLARALNPGSESEKLYDPFLGDQFKTKAVRINSSRENPGYTAVAGPRALDHKNVKDMIRSGTYDVSGFDASRLPKDMLPSTRRTDTARSDAVSAASRASARNRARASARGPASAASASGSAASAGSKRAHRVPAMDHSGSRDRLARLEEIVERERSQIEVLERELQSERQKRSQVEQQVQSLAATASKVSASEERVKKVEKVMSELMKVRRLLRRRPARDSYARSHAPMADAGNEEQGRVDCARLRPRIGSIPRARSAVLPQSIHGCNETGAVDVVTTYLRIAPPSLRTAQTESFCRGIPSNALRDFPCFRRKRAIHDDLPAFAHVKAARHSGHGRGAASTLQRGEETRATFEVQVSGAVRRTAGASGLLRSIDRYSRAFARRRAGRRWASAARALDCFTPLDFSVFPFSRRTVRVVSSLAQFPSFTPPKFYNGVRELLAGPKIPRAGPVSGLSS